MFWVRLNWAELLMGTESLNKRKLFFSEVKFCLKSDETLALQPHHSTTVRDNVSKHTTVRTAILTSNDDVLSDFEPTPTHCDDVLLATALALVHAQGIGSSVISYDGSSVPDVSGDLVLRGNSSGIGSLVTTVIKSKSMSRGSVLDKALAWTQSLARAVVSSQQQAKTLNKHLKT